MRQKIEHLKCELQQWDWLQNTLMLDQKTVENKKDFIKWEIRSLEQRIAKYVCALTAPVQEGDWDNTAILEKTGYL